MLAGAADNCVRNWVFEPVLDATGKPELASTLVTVAFSSGTSGHSVDDKAAQQFFKLEATCRQEMMQQVSTARQAADCLKAAQAAESFAPEERFVERRGAYVITSAALLRNHQQDQALTFANKAVSAVEQGHDDDSGASAAYSARAQAEAVSGDLAKASEDLATAEQHEREAIRKMTSDAPELVKREYIPSLKYILNLEARVFAAQGNRVASAEKASEAAKL